MSQSHDSFIQVALGHKDKSGEMMNFLPNKGNQQSNYVLLFPILSDIPGSFNQIWHGTDNNYKNDIA